MERKLYRGAQFTDGYKEIMSLVRMSDFYDPWGTGMAWLFAMAEVMYVEFDEVMPNFGPSPALAIRAATEGYEAESLYGLLDSGIADEADIRAAFQVMSRFDDWCRLAGRNY